MVLEPTHGLMDAFTSASGIRARCKESDFTPGMIKSNTKANIMQIRNKAMENTRGLTVECTKASGKKANSMDLESKLQLSANKPKERLQSRSVMGCG